LKPRTLEGEHLLRLVQLVARQSFMPDHRVVKKFEGAVFPVVRTPNRQLRLTKRDPTTLYDDNTSPRWAFLWSHGKRATQPQGWAFAHVWPESKCRACYTCIANLMMVPEYFGSLTDKASPLCAFFRFHAWEKYHWKPSTQEKPSEPRGY